MSEKAKMPRSNKKPSIVHSPANSSSRRLSMNEDSFDLLSDSRDSLDLYTSPGTESRFTTSQSTKLPEPPRTRTPPGRSQSSRFADRLSPSPTLTPTMKNILSPRTTMHEEEAALVSYSPSACKEGSRNMDLSFGCAEMPAEKPWSPGPPVYDTSKTKSFKLHKLKEPSLEDEWNDIVAEKKNRYRDFCCCVFSSTILILIVAAIIVATLYFIVRPNHPVVHVTDLNVTNFKLLTSATSDGALSLEAGMSFVAKITNPNKFATIHHREVVLTLNFREEVLSHTSVHAFKQSQKNVTSLSATLPRTLTKITEPLDVIELEQEVNDADVRVELRGSAEGHYELMGIKVKNLDVPVLCKLNVKPETKDSAAEIIASSCYNTPS
ncbi:hypothetical protein R1flu_010933 [Riccia fluitans]|uniref:Late embryogenesis abundant protein LEA-2 subgroup domain-containing protein n=1 Tax=Riccia fluitans TaxID=41844 RepID=A0ABD1Z6D3_9MARC